MVIAVFDTQENDLFLSYNSEETAARLAADSFRFIFFELTDEMLTAIAAK